MRIYLIRHGETDWNASHRFQGREDIPLNDNGITQARNSGRALAGKGITAVYASPLNRAVRTAEIVSGELGLSPHKVMQLPELLERELGSYSGKYLADFPEYFSPAYIINSGRMEPFEDVCKRMLRALELISFNTHGIAAAVSHGAAINALLSALSCGEIGTGKTRLGNACISIIEGSTETGFKVMKHNLSAEDMLSD